MPKAAFCCLASGRGRGQNLLVVSDSLALPREVIMAGGRILFWIFFVFFLWWEVGRG